MKVQIHLEILYGTCVMNIFLISPNRHNQVMGLASF